MVSTDCSRNNYTFLLEILQSKVKSQKCLGRAISLATKCILKGLSVIVHSTLHFFPNPQIFLHNQRELHCNSLPIQKLSRKQHIFGKRQFFVVRN